MPRNFTCPQTNEPCDEGGCKKGVLCVLEERERANARASQEAARERRRRVGWVNPATSRGTFSLRSPARPNPIGTSIETSFAIEGAIVTVRGLDCFAWDTATRSQTGSRIVQADCPASTR